MKTFFSLIFTFLSTFLFAQNSELPFKYDSLYNRIYAKDLCDFLSRHPDFQLIDVRSPGEFSDTSRYASLNQGRLKGAINLPIDSIMKNISVINPYKNKTLVFYCSHSQRSRRVSKLMTENGITNFFNLNGGMSNLNELSESEFPCKNDWIQSSLPYQNLSFDETAKLISSEKNLVIIDIRPKNQFNSTDTTLSNNAGHLKKSINIPYTEFSNHLTEFEKYRSQPILIYSSSGDGDGGRAAKLLFSNGFKKVYHMLGGINSFLASQENISMIENTPFYTLLSAERTLKLLKNTPRLTIYDTRENDEYSNKITGMRAYKNLGHIINSIHVDEKSFASQSFPSDKKSPILIYGNEESYKLAAQLTKSGYQSVYLLESFYSFVWSGKNVANCRDNLSYLTDHHGLY